LGSVGGAALAAHRGVDKVAFTGSTVTGRKVMEAAATSNLKKVSLELGGKSPHLIFESANIEQGIVHDMSGSNTITIAMTSPLAANWAAMGILYNTGQDCTAGSRLYVQDAIYDKFVATLAAKAKQLVIGDGFDERSGGGPVVSNCPPSGALLYLTILFKVSKIQYDRVWSYIESGKKEGAKVILGGQRRQTAGYWVDATSLPVSPS
jgi:aldehyde dehydrogenase (NAD+)